MPVRLREIGRARAQRDDLRAVAPAASALDRRPASALSLRELLVEDFATYDGRLSEPGLWAVIAHRLGARADRVESLPEQALLEASHRVLSGVVALAWGIDLPKSVALGRRLRLWHSGCMRLHAKRIGDDVHIRHDTTLGPVRMQESDKLPTLEDRVDLGSGVCVLGDVSVGHDAFVGANSLVLRDVPAGSTVLGVPARVLPT